MKMVIERKIAPKWQPKEAKVTIEKNKSIVALATGRPNHKELKEFIGVQAKPNKGNRDQLRDGSQLRESGTRGA